MSLTSSILTVHERIYKATDGRLGHRMVGVPTLLLRTTGRRSGAIRTNGLVYARDGEDYLVVASNGGSDRPPAWLYNLTADPKVDSLLAQTTSQPDPVARAALYNAADKQLATNDVTVIPLFQKPTQLGYKNTITGVKDNPTQDGFTWNIEAPSCSGPL